MCLLIVEVVLSPSLEAYLPKSEGEEQTNVPCDHPQPAQIINPSALFFFSFFVLFLVKENKS